MVLHPQHAIRVTLIRDGYDPFIDFLKGICIILVILNHSLPRAIRDGSGFDIWGKPAVPVFLLLQAFHACKKGTAQTRTDFPRLWKRVVRPFLATEILIVFLSLLFPGKGHVSFFSLISAGGLGPGSYFPWVFVQFAVFLPLLAPVFSRLKPLWLLVFFVSLAEFAEIVCCVLQMPGWLYRLLFLRYVFLFWLGFRLASDECRLDFFSVVLATVSLGATFFFAYSQSDLSPLFLNAQKPWKVCHWICYPYIVFYFILPLQWVYFRARNAIWAKYVRKIGIVSYEVFLFQLMYFAVFRQLLFDLLWTNAGGSLPIVLLKALFDVLVCIIPVMAWKKGQLDRLPPSSLG